MIAWRPRIAGALPPKEIFKDKSVWERPWPLFEYSTNVTARCPTGGTV
jgi:hypothetical protein